MIHADDRVRLAGRGSKKQGLGTVIEVRDDSCYGRHFTAVVEWDLSGKRTLWSTRLLKVVERAKARRSGR